MPYAPGTLIWNHLTAAEPFTATVCAVQIAPLRYTALVSRASIVSAETGPAWDTPGGVNVVKLAAEVDRVAFSVGATLPLGGPDSQTRMLPEFAVLLSTKS